MNQRTIPTYADIFVVIQSTNLNHIKNKLLKSREPDRKKQDAWGSQNKESLKNERTIHIQGWFGTDMLNTFLPLSPQEIETQAINILIDQIA